MTDEAFTEGIVSLCDSLYRISYGLLRGEQDRRDAVQEALARAWEKRRSLRNDRYLKTWVIRILINECHNIQRRSARHAYVVGEVSTTIPDRSLHDAILALPETYRIPIMLHYMEGYSLQEIAVLLRLPVGTVGTRLHRGRARLSGLLDAP